MPNLVWEANPRQSTFVPSTAFGSTMPLIEAPSRGQPKGNVTSGGERRIFHVLNGVENLEAKLFSNKAHLKAITSQVAMHLSSDERRSLFEEIDRLLSASEWEDESSEIDEKSFRSFLRFTIYAHPRRLPNLGVSPDGSLLAGWHSGEKSAHAEFFADDQCVAFVRLQSPRGPERIARRGHVAGLREFIENNDAVECIE